MTTRTQQIKGILPKIDSNDTTVSEHESFQNETLRSILKFQNELIIQYFEHFIVESKIEFIKLKYTHKITKINKIA